MLLPAAPAAEARALLPDLRQEPPLAVGVRMREGRVLLVFGSAVDVVGGGPLVIVGSRDRRRERMAVQQLVRRSDGSWLPFRLPRARLRYVQSATHRHWHLQGLGFDRYELRRASDGRLVATAKKAGFCLGDRYRLGLDVTRPGQPAEAVFTRECAQNEPAATRVVEGISVGYGDDYPPLREGQEIDVTGLAGGRYVLVHRADPERVLRVANRSDDVASALVALRTDGQPSVGALARCAGTARCGTARARWR